MSFTLMTTSSAMRRVSESSSIGLSGRHLCSFNLCTWELVTRRTIFCRVCVIFVVQLSSSLLSQILSQASHFFMMVLGHVTCGLFVYNFAKLLSIV